MNDNTFKATGEGSAFLRANWSRTFDAIAVVLELCSKAHAIEAAATPPTAAKNINGAASPEREKRRNGGGEDENGTTSSSLDVWDEEPDDDDVDVDVDDDDDDVSHPAGMTAPSSSPGTQSQSIVALLMP